MSTDTVLDLDNFHTVANWSETLVLNVLTEAPILTIEEFGVWHLEEHATTILNQHGIADTSCPHVMSFYYNFPIPDGRQMTVQGIFCNQAFLNLPVEIVNAMLQHEVGHFRSNHFTNGALVNGRTLEAELEADSYIKEEYKKSAIEYLKIATEMGFGDSEEFKIRIEHLSV